MAEGEQMTARQTCSTQTLEPLPSQLAEQAPTAKRAATKQPQVARLAAIALAIA